MARIQKTILLVDDDKSNLTALTIALSKKYLVISGNDGRKGLLQAETHSGSIDIVITDLSMPEMNGLEMSKKINEKYPQIPIIMTSGLPPDHLPCFIKKFLMKPYGIKKLYEAINSLI